MTVKKKRLRSIYNNYHFCFFSNVKFLADHCHKNFNLVNFVFSEEPSQIKSKKLFEFHANYIIFLIFLEVFVSSLSNCPNNFI